MQAVQIESSLNNSIAILIISFSVICLGLERIDNYKIVSQIPCELALDLKIDNIKKVLYNYWKPYIDEQEKVVVDATCYESEVRYPTDQKLLWKSVEWLYRQLKHLCKVLY